MEPPQPRPAVEFAEIAHQCGGAVVLLEGRVIEEGGRLVIRGVVAAGMQQAERMAELRQNGCEAISAISEAGEDLADGVAVAHVDAKITDEHPR